MGLFFSDKTKILVVDDDPEGRLLVRLILEARGMKIFDAENGRLGVALSLREKPDLIIMDLMMPIMSGLEATQAIHSNPKTRDIPIIILTADANVGTLDKAIQAGAKGFLHKPAPEEVLWKKIREFLPALPE